jgi:ribosomal protein S18 acetylase RimI-like enzyme
MSVKTPQKRLDVDELHLVLWFNKVSELRSVSPGEVIGKDIWVLPHENDSWVGVACIEPHSSEITRLAVREEYRREGHGETLVKTLAEKYGQLTLYCRESLAANQFYEDIGWNNEGIQQAEPENLIKWSYSPSEQATSTTT